MNEILKNYELDIIKIVELNKGYSANKWIIETKTKKYILKEENISELRMKYILYIIENIKDITASVIKTKNTCNYVSYNNKLYYLMDYIDSQDIDKIFSNKKYYNLGIFLGKLHNKLSTLNKYQDSYLDFNDNYNVLNKYLKDAEENNYIEYIEILKYKISILNELDISKIDLTKLSSQIVHGDFYIDNVLYDDRFKVIDFDQSCNFYKEYEVLRAMFLICLSNDYKSSLTNMKEFMHGYLQFNVINSPEDSYNLYLYVQANSLSSLKKERYKNDEKRKFALKRYNILKFLVQEKENIIKILSI